MATSWCISFLALFVAVFAHTHDIHKICVPQVAVKACHKMVEQAKTIGVNLECVPARDRVECISKVKDHEADFEALEPEDMYIAAQMSDKDFTVFKEIRTKEEPQAEFRYEGVAVIHKDLEINSIHGLKGLTSCHTGVGRNVGYKIPITKLTKMGVLGPLSDTSLSPRENELKALSNFFSRACLVGKWSPHPETNARLKSTYANLCELCENPEKCDYPDVNSGYEGALRCLAKAGGQVAWTKVIFVKKFFGMPYGTQPARQSEYNPADFAFLCPDATKRPITGPPCTWAARPWPGFMASTHAVGELKELREEIAKLNNLGESTHADWIATVLTLNNKTLTVDNQEQSPLNYLLKAKYKDVIERDVLEPKRVVRICVKTDTEMAKCEALKAAAYSRDIRPSLSCVQSANCIVSVEKKEAELVVLDPHVAIDAEKNHNLKPLLNEQYNKEDSQEIVAVVKKGSPMGSIQDLKGKKACFQPNGNAGFFGVLKYLLNNKMIGKNHCPHEKSLTEFFSAIVPSVDPVQCLLSGKGDVAFVPVSVLHGKDSEVELICSSGGRASVSKADCGIVDIPPRMVMTCKDLSEVQIDEARSSLLAAANLYSAHPDLFLLFGDFNKEPNVMFSNHATGLSAIADVLPSFEKYKKLVVDLAACA
ncbi:transferrin [Halyomorpha halys]|uniref:transferrin n=1 Tax=Halyomorpha halys TaxID=286706 RepID=UPI0006D4D04E|nr:transferrin-like [Halyomorpha halys]